MVSAKQPGVRLQHMLENIDGLLAATAGLRIDAILESFILIRTTERALQIISEAAKELPPDMRATEPDIPWKALSGSATYFGPSITASTPPTFRLSSWKDCPSCVLPCRG